MPIVLGLFGLAPLLLGLVLEYLCCRLPKRRKLWRVLPPALSLLFGAAAGWVRLDNWESETVSPVTQLLIFPGVPTVCLLLGCYLGWRLRRRRWGPRVVDGRRR